MSQASGAPVEVIQAPLLIVGAGIIGSSIASALVHKVGGRGHSGLHPLCVDLDLGGEWSSSELNAGGVRATWSQEINLLASKKSIEYFATVADVVGYRPCGYLWMHRPETFEPALKAREQHVAQGWPVEVWDVPTLRRQVPWIDKTDDLAGALFGVKDGLVNPNRLKEHFREQAIQGGAQFLDGVWIHSVSQGPHWKFKAFRFHLQAPLPSALKRKILEGEWTSELESLGRWIEIHTPLVVNAAGAWAPKLATLLGLKSPSKPVRRQISLFHARDIDLTPHGMMIDPSGVYFHPEAIYGLSGFATRDEPDGFNFHYDGDRFFEESIWPQLYERASGFESLKHVSGWAGLYEESPDHHAIVGVALDQPHGKVFDAHSFSGHGVMQSYAVGMAVSEWIQTGQYQTLDFLPLSGSRFLAGAKVKALQNETWVI